MRIAVAQIASGTDPSENLDLVAEYARRARDAQAGLVVFPEATMATFATRSVDAAEPLDGPWASRVRAIAAQVGIAIVVGMFTPGAPNEDGKPRARNTLLVVDAAGHDLAHYDKIHLFDAWGFVESRHIEAGDSPCLVTIEGVRVGLATCYDVRFPELFKHLANAGAEVIALPTSWANGPGKAEQFRALCLARALDSTCFVVAAGQADPAVVGIDVKPGSPTGVGHSVVLDPLGRVLAEAGDAPDLLVVDLDVATIPDARAQLPVLATSRFSIERP